MYIIICPDCCNQDIKRNELLIMKTGKDWFVCNDKKCNTTFTLGNAQYMKGLGDNK